MKRRILLAPVYSVPQLLEAEQLVARGFYREVAGVRYPGRFARLSATPLREAGPAPAAGADTEDVLREFSTAKAV